MNDASSTMIHVDQKDLLFFIKLKNPGHHNLVHKSTIRITTRISLVYQILFIVPWHLYKIVSTKSTQQQSSKTSRILALTHHDTAAKQYYLQSGWDKVQWGTVGGRLSCWGVNITDTRLYLCLVEIVIWVAIRCILYNPTCTKCNINQCLLFIMNLDTEAKVQIHAQEHFLALLHKIDKDE